MRLNRFSFKSRTATLRFILKLFLKRTYLKENRKMINAFKTGLRNYEGRSVRVAFADTYWVNVSKLYTGLTPTTVYTFIGHESDWVTLAVGAGLDELKQSTPILYVPIFAIGAIALADAQAAGTKAA